MASHTRSTKLPAALAEAAEIRAKALGYTSWNAYIKALIRYDLMIQGPHTVTLPISHLRPEEQDKLDEGLLERNRQGVGERGQWLETVINKVAGEKAAEIKAALPKAIFEDRKEKGPDES